MKCLSAFRDKKGGWLNCDKRTHFAASTLRPGWAYELRYCPECYERQLGLPCPPKVNRGDLPHFQPLDIPRTAGGPIKGLPEIEAKAANFHAAVKRESAAIDAILRAPGAGWE